MESIVLTFHYIICFVLILMILLQAGKGADIGAVFGGASQTMFGSQGPATFLNKLTIGVALGFIVTSIWLAQISKTQSTGSVLDKAPITEQAAPTTPAELPLEPAAPAPAAPTPAK